MNCLFNVNSYIISPYNFFYASWLAGLMSYEKRYLHLLHGGIPDTFTLTLQTHPIYGKCYLRTAKWILSIYLLLLSVKLLSSSSLNVFIDASKMIHLPSFDLKGKNNHTIPGSNKLLKFFNERSNRCSENLKHMPKEPIEASGSFFSYAFSQGLKRSLHSIA